MNRRTLGKVILFSLPLVILLCASEKVFASAPHFDFSIQFHHLIAEIDPSRHLLKVEDRLEIARRGRAQTLSLLLNPKL